MPKSEPVATGQKLTVDAVKKVQALRARVKSQLPAAYDTDFNLYRWIASAEKLHRCKTSNDVVDKAAKALGNHLLYRRLMKIDEQTTPSWDDNPLYKMRIMPRGHIAAQPDSKNRLTWCLEYRTLKFETILLKLKSTEMVLYQFWLFEHVLRQVMLQERATGLLSSIFHVVDLADYSMSPMNMLFVSNGSLAYYANLMHYEHYPELITTTYFVNCAKWMTMPYRLIKSMMPASFGEKFQLHEGKYTEGLLEYMHPDNIPDYLGGNNTQMATVTALPFDELEIEHMTSRMTKMVLRSVAHVDDIVHIDDQADVPHQHIEDNVFSAEKSLQLSNDSASGSDDEESEENEAEDDDAVDDAEADANRNKVTISARRRKIIPVEVGKANTRLYWHYTTDADVYFGVFKHPEDKLTTSIKKLENEQLEMVYPWLKLGARMVPETDMVICKSPGTYYLIFCNRHSWFQRRNVHLKVDIHTVPFRIERTFSM